MDMEDKRIGMAMFFIMLGVILVMISILCLSAGIEDGIAGILCTLGIGIVACAIGVRIIVATATRDKHCRETKKNLTYNRETGELYLKRREKSNSHVISFWAYTPKEMVHHDATLQYTGVTVGGVSTGQFSVNPEHYTMAYTRETGKYFVCYNNDIVSGIVRSIKIDSALIKSAKDNPVIKGMLNDKGDCIITTKSLSFGQRSMSEMMVQAGVKENRHDYIHNTNIQDMMKQAISRKEAKAVVDWVTRKI